MVQFLLEVPVHQYLLLDLEDLEDQFHLEGLGLPYHLSMMLFVLQSSPQMSLFHLLLLDLEGLEGQSLLEDPEDLEDPVHPKDLEDPVHPVVLGVPMVQHLLLKI